MKAKIIMLSALGVASFGLTQAASASWDSGACSGGGSAPCIEWSDGSNTYHFNGSGGHAGDWHGHPGGGDFEFTGPTNLVCDGIPVDCDLTLYGQVRKAYDSTANTWKVGIQVTNADVTGGFTCGFVDVGGFPWFVDENHEHGPYTNAVDVGIPYPITSFIGSIGEIDVAVPILGISVTDGHMHDITYNNSDTFSFGTGTLDEIIYINGAADDDSGCRVSGDLRLQPAGDTLSIQ